MRSSVLDNTCAYLPQLSPEQHQTGQVAPEIPAATEPAAPAVRPPRRVRRRVLVLLVVLILAMLAAIEARTSFLVQARVLPYLARDIGFAPAAGPAPAPRYPVTGPYDQRLGYTLLPGWLASLSARGYAITSQARLTPAFAQTVDRGLFAPYHEKQQAGLDIRDRHGNLMFANRYPRAVYADDASIPPLVSTTLAFIEDRGILDPDTPHRNPALAWERLGQALVDQFAQVFDPDRNGSGGSTLATQLEKFRHSHRGLTPTVGEKLRQVASASLRVYQDGPDTLPARREIMRAYLNGVPLAARAGYGEVHGLNDGLRVWFQADPLEVNRLLAFTGEPPPEQIEAAALAYRQVLSLLLAQQRPTWFLGNGGFPALVTRVDEYARLLERAGIISPRFRDAVLAQRLVAPGGAPAAVAGREAYSSKSAYMIRSRLLTLLGLQHVYDLDRLDLGVRTTLDASVQQAVTDRLLELRDPAHVKAANLLGTRLLEADDDLNRVIYSFTLYEVTERANVLRVQADNLSEPIDINEGVRLDLGSTAKLRTLVHYLEIMAGLYHEYAALPAADLRALRPAGDDVLRAWMIDRLSRNATRELRPVLEAALERRYSASPAETFITGGGAHRFANFKRSDNDRVVTLREAFRDSINLPFVRLMRDIVRYHVNRSESSRRLLDDPAEPLRIEYLKRFADREGKTFLKRFYRKYAGRTVPERFALLVDSVRTAPVPLAIIYRSVHPQDDPARFEQFLDDTLPGEALDGKIVERLYTGYAPEKYSLMDRGYLAKLHPLELWLVAWLQEHPDASFADCVAASTQERIDVYTWLFKTSNKSRQDNRIRTMLEIEAFNSVHAAWSRLGYPFSYLTPSYATAIGSSADRPSALADLMGIIVRGGVRAPAVRVEELHFATGTPWEVRLDYQGTEPVRVLPEEVAATLRAALLDVVGNGTAVRLAKGLQVAEGVTLPVGGKTGTGDHRNEEFDAAGRLLRERVVNRTATFVFFIGDRFYGTISAYVPGESAADYTFTSSLPVELLRQLAPQLLPLFTAAGTPTDGNAKAQDNAVRADHAPGKAAL